jgi:hypothetical protein
MKIFVTICEDGDGYPQISRIALNPHILRKTKEYEDNNIYFCELTQDEFIDSSEIEHWKKLNFKNG